MIGKQYLPCYVSSILRLQETDGETIPSCLGETKFTLPHPYFFSFVGFYLFLNFTILAPDPTRQIKRRLAGPKTRFIRLTYFSFLLGFVLVESTSGTSFELYPLSCSGRICRNPFLGFNWLVLAVVAGTIPHRVYSCMLLIFFFSLFFSSSFHFFLYLIEGRRDLENHIAGGGRQLHSTEPLANFLPVQCVGGQRPYRFS